MVSVSVIVVARNEERTVARCLDSLTALDFPRDEHEIIVVDGASTDRTREICQRYHVRLICLKKTGISFQRNVGVEAAKGAYVAFTDADCYVDKSWLRNLVRGIEQSDSGVVAVGGPNLVPDEDPPLSKVIGYAQETFLGSGGSPQSYRMGKPTYVDSIPNCNVLYRKEVVAGEKYDETFSVGDDGELNFRLRRQGYRFLYLPQTRVWHHRPETLRDFARKMFCYGAALGQMTRKHRRIVRWYAPLAGFAVLAVIFSYPITRFLPQAIYIYSSAVLLYAVALAISTVQVCRRYRSIRSTMTLILLPLQHFLYGLGFLIGFSGLRVLQ